MFSIDLTSPQAKNYITAMNNINRSAFPVAVRQTLNDAAFDVKTNTMLKESNVFVHRTPTFFKANSKVIPASGFDINAMKSQVGFRPKISDKSHSVEDLEQQENGGTIGQRTFITLKEGRTGGSYKKNVKASNRMKVISSKIVDSKDIQGSTKGVQFTRAKIKAGVGGYVISNLKNRKGNKTLIRVNSLGRGFGKNATTRIASVQKDRKVDPDNKYEHFMLRASMATRNKMNATFINNANKQINKVRL